MKFSQLPTPCYVVDEKKLVDNLLILQNVEKESGCKILLAQKAFSMFSLYSLIGKYISGTCSSGLFEAKLGFDEMGKENHIFSPAYKEEEFDQITKMCDHIVFNSVAQLKNFKDRCKNNSIGLRINPCFSTQSSHHQYDPCAPGSRFGVKKEDFDETLLKYIDGLHFHTLCEQDSDDLERTFFAFEKSFGKYLSHIKWINLGGGHHITKPGYDIPRLVKLIKYIKSRYNLEVYLEPGEAIALNAGYLVTKVLDIVENEYKTLILDTSAACHMPDVIEMPYRPPLKDSGLENEKKYTYCLSSISCLAGDIIGKYSFDKPVQISDRLVFEDMAIYTMVKNNTFNGIGLPSIVLMHSDGNCEIIKSFGYKDFKERLS